MSDDRPRPYNSVFASEANQSTILRRFGAAAALSGALGIVWLFAGCAGYQLGPTNGVSAGSKSVQITLFKNELLEPRLSEALATALRRTVQQDGTYRLETHDDGDLIVTGSMTRLDRSALSFQPSDILTPRDYSLTLMAKVLITEARSGKVIFDGSVNGHTTVRAGGDLVAAERQAVPLLAEDLARNITSKLVDGTW